MVRAKGRLGVAGAALAGREEHPTWPTLPAFVIPNVLRVLVDKFDIKPTTTAEADVASIMAGA